MHYCTNYDSRGDICLLQVGNSDFNPSDKPVAHVAHHGQGADPLEQSRTVDEPFAKKNCDENPVLLPVRHMLARGKIMRLDAVTGASACPNRMGHLNSTVFPSLRQCSGFDRNPVNVEPMSGMEQRVLPESAVYIIRLLWLVLGLNVNLYRCPQRFRGIRVAARIA